MPRILVSASSGISYIRRRGHFDLCDDSLSIQEACRRELFNIKLCLMLEKRCQGMVHITAQPHECNYTRSMAQCRMLVSEFEDSASYHLWASEIRILFCLGIRAMWTLYKFGFAESMIEIIELWISSSKVSSTNINVKCNLVLWLKKMPKVKFTSELIKVNP